MGKSAVIFPGQGAQTVGMGRDVYERSAAGRAVFDLADRVLPFSLTEVIFEGPADRLTSTDISQPAILATSMAIAAAARELGWDGQADAAAGLSLGEYSALVFAGSLDLEEALVLVNKRGMYMREAGAANPGGMLSVIGLDEAAIGRVLESASSAGLICAANLNCPGQVVLSGEVDALQAAEGLAEEAGAMKTVMLKVDGAFHSPLMKDAAGKLGDALSSVSVSAPKVPFVANATGDFEADPGRIKELLVEQVTSSVLWEKSMRLLESEGIAEFNEIGPGRVLTGLLKRINRKLKASVVGDMDAAAGLAGGAS